MVPYHFKKEVVLLYTILMNDDKSLTISTRIKLYQRENLVDKVQFLFPQTYEEQSLRDFTFVLKYTDSGQVAHAEILTIEDELYKDKLRCTLPIDTELTRYAGDITLRITLTRVDADEAVQYVLHTGDVKITISPVSDLYAFITDESLEVIDQKIGELDAKIQALDLMTETYDKTKADDLLLTEDLLQVSAGGQPIGKGVHILIPSTDDGAIDGSNDGILNLDTIEL